ncbi:FusB/FusC family EF-G-binding protein [Pradoshia sp.]|uniref:FusB/FusC family EF-G-binding protein n=1 Tax=Pradoshia sp. TaxID=2651281 RepID=UPI003F0CAF03
MKPFIENHQYVFIREKARQIVHARHTVHDRHVQETFIDNSQFYVYEQFQTLTDEQRECLNDLSEIRTEADYERFLSELVKWRIPFPALSDAQLTKLFRKVKKLQYPLLPQEQMEELTYFGWTHNERKFIVKAVDGSLRGISGRITPSSKQGLCHFCHKQAEVGLFSVERKVRGKSMNYQAFAHYICQDSMQCNQHLANVERIDAFMREALGL